MLLHFAPGAPREAYFEGLAKFATTVRPSDEELAEFYLGHDNSWLLVESVPRRGRPGVER